MPNPIKYSATNQTINQAAAWLASHCIECGSQLSPEEIGHVDVCMHCCYLHEGDDDTDNGYYNQDHVCMSCHGTGCDEYDDAMPCEDCDGTGRQWWID